MASSNTHPSNTAGGAGLKILSLTDSRQHDNNSGAVSGASAVASVTTIRGAASTTAAALAASSRAAITRGTSQPEQIRRRQEPAFRIEFHEVDKSGVRLVYSDEMYMAKADWDALPKAPSIHDEDHALSVASTYRQHRDGSLERTVSDGWGWGEAPSRAASSQRGVGSSYSTRASRSASGHLFASQGVGGGLAPRADAPEGAEAVDAGGSSAGGTVPHHNTGSASSDEAPLQQEPERERHSPEERHAPNLSQQPHPRRPRGASYETHGGGSGSERSGAPATASLPLHSSGAVGVVGGRAALQQQLLVAQQALGVISRSVASLGEALGIAPSAISSGGGSGLPSPFAALLLPHTPPLQEAAGAVPAAGGAGVSAHRVRTASGGPADEGTAIAGATAAAAGTVAGQRLAGPSPPPPATGAPGVPAAGNNAAASPPALGAGPHGASSSAPTSGGLAAGGAADGLTSTPPPGGAVLLPALVMHGSAASLPPLGGGPSSLDSARVRSGTGTGGEPGSLLAVSAPAVHSPVGTAPGGAQPATAAAGLRAAGPTSSLLLLPSAHEGSGEDGAGLTRLLVSSPPAVAAGSSSSSSGNNGLVPGVAGIPQHGLHAHSSSGASFPLTTPSGPPSSTASSAGGHSSGLSSSLAGGVFEEFGHGGTGGGSSFGGGSSVGGGPQSSMGSGALGAAGGGGGGEVERLRAELEALNAAKRKLMVEHKKLQGDMEERAKEVTVLKQKLSRAGVHV